MDEEKKQKSEELSDKDVKEIRSDIPPDELLKLKNTDGVVHVTLDDPPPSEDDLKKREIADEIEAGRVVHQDVFGSEAQDDHLARAFARFDPGEAKPQAAEFYRYTNKEVEDKGYI